MRQRYVPSYYARDKLNELQCLKQGSSSIEDYYQELQTGYDKPLQDGVPIGCLDGRTSRYERRQIKVAI